MNWRTLKALIDRMSEKEQDNPVQLDTGPGYVFVAGFTYAHAKEANPGNLILFSYERD